jgi:hypothetical protein
MLRLLICLCLAGLPFDSAIAQEQGPVTPRPKREIKRIPTEAAPEPPPVPVEVIIKRATENDSELLRIRNGMTCRVSLRVQEFDDDGETAGELRLVKEVRFTAQGRPVEKMVEQPPSTLKQLHLEPEDVLDLSALPLFMLPAADLEHYELTYTGTQPVDELNTYVFRVRPRRLERQRRFFEGAIWIDDRDFAIVKSYGRYVREVEEDALALPFRLLESYRELVAEKYWLPAYLRSDDVIRGKSGEVRVRLTIRYSNCQLPAPAAQP